MQRSLLRGVSLELGEKEATGWLLLVGKEMRLGIWKGALEHVVLGKESTLSLKGEDPELWFAQAKATSRLFRIFLQEILRLPRGKLILLRESPPPPGAGFRLVPPVVDAFLDDVGGVWEEIS